MFKIIKIKKLSDIITEYEVIAPRIAKKAKPGQFVIVRLFEDGERIPLTIADFDTKNNTITLVVQHIGHSTIEMCKLSEGDSILDIAGPLGHPSKIEKNKTIVFVGGGLGIAPVYPIARMMSQNNNKVISILGAKTKDLLIWKDKMEEISDKVLIATDDGSLGEKGFVTNILEKIIPEEKPDIIYAIGPPIMMYSVAKATPEDIALVVSLNTLMVDGTGMCGGCRVTVDNEIKFTCVDGPEFDGHKVNYEEFLNRNNLYKKEEAHICRLNKYNEQ